MQAVILAAGCGSRLRAHHDLPKGFLCVTDRPIILESIQKLQQHGIHDILLITGYRSDVYETFAEAHPGVSTQFNPYFDTKSSLYSLYCAREWVKTDFLLLESDLFYEPRAMECLLADKNPSAILVSGQTHSGDEVYVEAKKNNLVNMSKQQADLNIENIQGEFVGINKLNYFDYQIILSLCEKNNNLLSTGHYEEHGLVALSQVHPLSCVFIPDLIWGEIDTIEQFERVRALCNATSY